MNSKTMFVFFAACAVSFSVAAQSSPSTLSLRGTPDLGLGAAATPKTAEAGDAAAEAAIRRALLSQPASEEEVTKALSFLPDVVAEVNGTKITKKDIVDLLLSKKVSQQVLALTPESYLRTAMQQYIEQKIDTAILKQKAKEAGFVPSEELVKTHFDASIKKLPAEQVDAVKAQLKERGLSLEAYRDEIAKEDDIQGNAAIAAYEEKNFIEKTMTRPSRSSTAKTSRSSPSRRTSRSRIS